MHLYVNYFSCRNFIFIGAQGSLKKDPLVDALLSCRKKVDAKKELRDV